MDIAQLRKRRGWTQQLLADASGLSLRTVQRVERGETRPTQETQLALAAALGSSPEEKWVDLEFERYVLAQELTVFCETLDQCFEKMREFVQQNPDHTFLTDSLVDRQSGEGFCGWRDCVTGAAFMVPVQVRFSLPELFWTQEEWLWVGHRISEGLDPWSTGDPKHSERRHREVLQKVIDALPEGPGKEDFKEWRDAY